MAMLEQGSSPPRRYTLRTDPKTSARLGRVRQRDTVPEVEVRRALHKLGHRFRIRNRDLPGSPDVANRSRRWAVFVHGCFWHRHPGCRRATTPKRNADFWADKFRGNQKRDARVQAELRRLGFDVIVVWECESEVRERLASILRKKLGTRSP